MTKRFGSVGSNLTVLKNAQKPGGGVPAYMRWVNRPIGRLFAAMAAAAGLTPNAVTALSFGFSIAGLGLLVLADPSWVTGILVALCLAIGFALDSADGQVARLTGSGGPAGEWMDHVVDAARQPMTHLAVAAALLVHRPDFVWAAIVAACFAVVSSSQFLSQILAEKLQRTSGKQQAPEATNRIKSFALLPNDTGVLCWCFVLWGAPAIFAVVYTALAILNTIHALASMRRKYLSLTVDKQLATVQPSLTLLQTPQTSVLQTPAHPALVLAPRHSQ